MERKHKQRGSAMVETALVMIVFVSMLVGIFDIGQVLYLHQSITERIREALRYGIVNPYDATAIQNYVLYGQPTASSGPTFYSITSSMVNVQRSDPGTEDDRITVTVSNYPYVFVSPFIAGAGTGAPISETLSYEGQ